MEKGCWIIVRNNGAEQFRGTEEEADLMVKRRNNQGYDARLIGPYDSKGEMEDTLIDILMRQDREMLR